MYVEDGVAKLDPLGLVTDKMKILGRGSVDLETEKIDLSWTAKPRRGLGLSASSITNQYLKLGGTLSKPHVTVKPLTAATTTAAAVGTVSSNAEPPCRIFGTSASAMVRAATARLARPSSKSCPMSGSVNSAMYRHNGFMPASPLSPQVTLAPLPAGSMYTYPSISTSYAGQVMVYSTRS